MQASSFRNRHEIGSGKWRIAVAIGAVVLLWAVGPDVAAALVIDVKAPDGTKVGSITVNVSADGKGIVGGFTSTYPQPPPPGTEPSLGGAAAKCGEDHFNWFQVVTADNKPPNGADGKPLTPPYLDPPLGGYGGDDVQWADNRFWYWDETAPAAGTPGYDARYQLSNQTTNDTLHYEDFPGGAPGTQLGFSTWLASVNADGSLHSFHGGFSWTWQKPAGGGSEGSGRRDLEIPGVWPPDHLAGTVVLLPTPLTPQQGWQAYQTFVPEPSSFLLAGLGLLGLVVVVLRRRRG